ncbi:uncharacterized protein LOC111044226 [Nilaparvata lugens]|uniref:uncharacterized protein LOC111044226 n=1 Tax=Nilaparvata lugens TaxID=108931 RepID=UPI00193DE830|nr:uncharacterized protein LOC111044226 [Nilaparvata lugens]
MRSARGLYWLLPVLLCLISSEAVQDGNKFEAGEIQREIDNEIAKYLEDVKKVLHKDEKRKLMKRSTSASGINLSKLEEAPRFSSIERLYELPDPFAVDAVLFCLPAEKDGDEKCFAASLLTSDAENVDQLVLYTLNGDKFLISDRTEVKNGRSLATHNIGGVQYIVVAENRLVDANETVSDLYVSPVYAVDNQTGRLRRLHYLGDGHLTDAIIWEQKGTDNVFLATASAAIEGSQPGDVSHVYRWMGNHFDMTHIVATSNASRITHFTIGGNMFLAVANAGTDAANMFSAVYMYNLHEERFVLHQKLPTHSATDIKSFTLHLAEGSETFLAVTSRGHNNHPSVIIYKLLPDSYHFVPMQLLPLEDIEGTEGRDDIKGTEGMKGTEGTKGIEEGAELLLPVVHEDASGVLASVLLVASRKWGVKVYQYDGWRFVLSETQLNQQEFGPGVSSMRLFRFKGRNVVTLVNKRSVSLVFSVKWKVNDVMKALQSHLESWCDQVLKEEEDLETASNNLLREAQWAPKLNESFETGGCLIFDNPNTLIRTVEITNDVTKPDNEAVRRKFEEVKQDVRETEEALKGITKELIFEEPVVLESADFKCLHGCVFLNLEIGTLNGENFSTFLDNSHGLSGKHVDKIEFETLNVTSLKTVDKINGRPIKHLVTSDGDEDLRFDINVNGRVTFNGKLTVNGEIDGVKFDNNTLLLDSGVQFFNNSKLSVESLIVDKLTVKNQQPQFKSTEIDNVKVDSSGNNFIPVLDVKDLKLEDNKISGVDFGDFVEKTLKKTGNKEQIIEGFHHYKVLIADEIEAPNYKPMYKSGVELQDNKVGDKIVENGKARGDKVEDVIEDKVGDVKAEDVTIDQTKRGNYDVDKNSDPKLPKKCSGAQCVEEQFRIDGNFEIDGSLVIENATLFVEDVYLGHENISLSDLLKNGLKLDGGMISDVVFQAPIFVQHLDVDSVNHIDPNSWIDGCDPGNQPIVVTGHKVFTDSLNLEQGGSVTGKINEIPVDRLMFDTLRKDGDQDVEGFKHIGKITAKVIESDSLALKNDDVTGKAKTHSGGDLVVNHMKGRMLRAKTINGIVLEDVINDTLFKDNKTYVVESKTTFINDLKTDELFCDDVYELSNHTNERRMTGDSTPVRNTTGSENLNLTSADVEGKQLKVDRLYFTGSLDGVSAEDFGNWLLVEGDQTIESLCEIKNIEAKNGVKLTTGLLNGVDLDEFVKDMININEPVVLTSDVVFEGEVVVENGVKIEGLVNGIEFSEEELVLKGMDPVVFGGEKVLEGDLQAKSIDVDALKTFCKVVVEPQGDGSPSQPFKVVGNVEFSKEPTITFLNDQNVSELLDSLWFMDEDIVIDHDMVLGDVELKGNLNMSAGSEVNGKNLTRLREGYFSLSADQKITNDLIFDKITAGGLRVVERVQAYKLVAGMNFDEFVGSVMRQKRRQRVTAILDFEDVEVDGGLNANASWTVNGLDFKRDLMRWNNSVNIVRGKTRLTSLKTQSLEAKPGVLIQGIDISKWKQLAVTGSGRFNVSGHKTFDSNVYVDEDLRVHGLVNGIRFDPDSVLLSERYQTVNGHYLFWPGNRVGC